MVLQSLIPTQIRTGDKTEGDLKGLGAKKQGTLSLPLSERVARKD